MLFSIAQEGSDPQITLESWCVAEGTLPLDYVSNREELELSLALAGGNTPAVLKEEKNENDWLDCTFITYQMTLPLTAANLLGVLSADYKPDPTAVSICKALMPTDSDLAAARLAVKTEVEAIGKSKEREFTEVIQKSREHKERGKA